MIRTALQKDLPGIVAIYNQAILQPFQTADMDLLTVKDRVEWLEAHKPGHYPVLVFETDGEIRGWLSISPYRPGRRALRFCVEISFYVDQHFQRTGIGKALVQQACIVCKNLGYHSAFAIILDKNAPSIALMEHCGFTCWAHLPDIADFDGKTCGQVYYGVHFP